MQKTFLLFFTWQGDFIQTDNVSYDIFSNDKGYSLVLSCYPDPKFIGIDEHRFVLAEFECLTQKDCENIQNVVNNAIKNHIFFNSGAIPERYINQLASEMIRSNKQVENNMFLPGVMGFESVIDLRKIIESRNEYLN